jgi:hypothetical protein
MAESADAADLKSASSREEWGFEALSAHQPGLSERRGLGRRIYSTRRVRMETVRDTYQTDEMGPA